MQRPLAIKLLSAMLLVVALLAVVASVAVFHESSSERVRAEGEAKDVALVLRVVSGVLFMVALVELVLAMGMFRQSHVAWWMSILFHGTFVAIFVYESVTASSRDAEDILLPIAAAALVALHFLPGVRSWVRQPTVVAVVSNP